MPTNVTAEYKKAEQAFRQARDPHERLVCLKEMLRTLPKHKGTEHLQADIRSRIKGLSEALEGPKRGANRAGLLHTIRPSADRPDRSTECREIDSPRAVNQIPRGGWTLSLYHQAAASRHAGVRGCALSTH